jgi:hypothetical protein
MRRLVCFTVLTLALAGAAAGFALASSDDDGTLSVKSGIGVVNLNFNGSAVGRVARGSIKITDPVADDGYGSDFWNCKIEHDLTDATTICKGTNIRFRAIGGKYQIRIGGSGIYLSAVGHGLVGLNGAGDTPAVDSDGTYSLNDLPYRSLPDLGATFPLVAPAGG